MKISKLTYYVLAVLFVGMFTATQAQEAVDYYDFTANDEVSYFVSLATELHPSIYLDAGQMRQYGDEPARCLYTDVASIPMLYATDKTFSQVELVKVYINSPDDEAAKVNLSQLAAFENLKYILFVYQYDPCAQKDDACLKNKTEDKITTVSESSIKLLYQLSIPQ